MLVYDDILNADISAPTALTIGKMDALHGGHRELIKNVVKKANEGLMPVVVIFSDSPRMVLNKDFQEGKFIITKAERREMFAELGIEALVSLVFVKSMIETSPKDFIKLLSRKLNMKYICVGENFRYGFKGAGDCKLLLELSETFGYKADILKPVVYKDKTISSTGIREEIKKGNIEDANAMLGYSFFTKGPVSGGNMRGATLLFPTLNIIPTEDKIMPPFGVYATEVSLGGREYEAVSNIGYRPTRHESEMKITVETYLLGENVPTEATEAKVSFLKFIRPERKFDSISDLRHAVDGDIETAKTFFKG